MYFFYSTPLFCILPYASTIGNDINAGVVAEKGINLNCYFHLFLIAFLDSGS